MDAMTRKRVRIDGDYLVAELPDGSEVRAMVSHESYAPEPERGDGMWNNGVSLVRYADGYGGAKLDSHDGLEAVLDRIYRDHREGRYVWCVDTGPDADYGTPSTVLGDEDAMVAYVSRYLRIFHDVQHVSLRSHQGYSQGDWAEVWVIAEDIEDGADPDGIADATWQEWDAWAKGDVYSAELETRTLHDAMMAEDSEDGWKLDGHYRLSYGDDAAPESLAELMGVSADDIPAWWELPIQSNY